MPIAPIAPAPPPPVLPGATLSGPSSTLRSQDGHRAPVKKGIDQEQMRRKREATTVQIRKDKKEDNLQKRRRDVGGASSARSGQGDVTRHSSTHSANAPDPSLQAKLDSMPEDMQLLRSDSPADQLEATTRFRKLLSIERNPPIAEVIACGAVPRLVQCCQCFDNPQLLLEATWALTNISSGALASCVRRRPPPLLVPPPPSARTAAGVAHAAAALPPMSPYSSVLLRVPQVRRSTRVW